MHPLPAPTPEAECSMLLDRAHRGRISLVSTNRGNHNERMALLEESIRNFARIVGFDLVGIAPAVEADGFARLRDWLDRGYAGEMAYMSRGGDARRHPAAILPDVRSVVMVGM